MNEHAWDETLEVFRVRRDDITPDTVFWDEDENKSRGCGWYFWFCFPGCMPESEPSGPYTSHRQAYQAAEEMYAF